MKRRKTVLIPGLLFLFSIVSLSSVSGYSGEFYPDECLTITPEGVITARDHLNLDCYIDGRLSIPQTVSGIWVKEISGSNIFSATNIGELELPEGLEKIGGSTFFHTNITSIKFPSTIKEIGSFAFYGNLIEELELPEGLKILGESAFGGNRMLKRVKIPNSLEELGTGAFSNSPSLTEIEIPNTIKNIPNSVFANTSIKELEIPEGVEEIGKTAFASNFVLEKVKFPNTLKVIGEMAFSHSYLESVRLPDSLQEIGVQSFFSMATSGGIITGYTTKDPTTINNQDPYLVIVRLKQKLTIDDGNGNVEEKEYEVGKELNIPEPTREGHIFKGRENKPTDNKMPDAELTLIAKREQIKQSIGGSSGGIGRSGGSSSSSSETNTGSTTNTGSNNTNTGSTNTGTVNTGATNTGANLTGDTQDSSNKSSEGQSGYSQEFIDAYNFAKKNGITTMPTIDQADMTGNLTRIQMAKMLSYYAINIMGKKPDETRNNKFNDVSEKLNSDYNSGVTLAYQLGIMGINMPNNNFRPNDLVTRGEFVTALSRMIYGTKDGEYEGTSKYYTKHIEKLNEEEIIKQIDPSMKELRAYVMIMLKRASEK